MTPPVFTPTDHLLTVDRNISARSARVTATGELDSCTAPLLAAALEGVLSEDIGELTVDLGGVFFLDAAGVHALAAAAKHAAAMGTGLRLVASRPAVIRPLTIAGLRSLLETSAVITEAHEAA